MPFPPELLHSQAKTCSPIPKLSPSTPTTCCPSPRPSPPSSPCSPPGRSPLASAESSGFRAFSHTSEIPNQLFQVHQFHSTAFI